MPIIPMQCRRELTVRGTVQGVGFRPFVYRLAIDEQLTGWVRNEAEQVRIQIQGPLQAVQRFTDRLNRECPRPAHVREVCSRPLPIDPADSERPPGDAGRFLIKLSSPRGQTEPALPADLATCDDCLQEILDQRARRYRYPFTNCTRCGPRWSIVTQMPYDRPHTTMSPFAMCENCRSEYEDPADRRFHAQPIACPACGPHLKLLDKDGRQMAEQSDAQYATAQAVADGHIVAIKGLGGFQLVVDAGNDTAVRRLRTRKQRPAKPLAVMMCGLEMAEQYCILSAEAALELRDPSAPIVLLPRRSSIAQGTTPIAHSVAPENPQLGVMLPYTPLHHLLLDDLHRPIVCTSGNRSDEPMAIDTSQALDQLGAIADLILTHNRPIRRPVDDSVLRLVTMSENGDRDEQPGWNERTESRQTIRVPVRRARGFAPRPIRLRRETRPALAVGGHLKNTVAIATGSNIVLSPYIGDLDHRRSRAVQRQTVDDLVDFFSVRPEVVACDLHPDYASTRLAEQLADQWDARLVRWQHHHAHVLALMAEHQLSGPLLGFAWDGTGYGTDGTVWGGEGLLCEADRYKRVAQIRPFPLPGGEQAIREPRRAALGLLCEMLGPERAGRVSQTAGWFQTEEKRLLLAATAGRNCFPLCSSIGRLFDAVAALCGLAQMNEFEGQAAMALEFAVDQRETGALPWGLVDNVSLALNWEPMIREVLSALDKGVPVGRLAARFHRGLAQYAVEVADRVGCRRVGLSGGCFLNQVLVRLVSEGLRATGREVYTHSQVPPGDGGISLGQLYGLTLAENQAGDGKE